MFTPNSVEIVKVLETDGQKAKIAKISFYYRDIDKYLDEQLKSIEVVRYLRLQE